MFTLLNYKLKTAKECSIISIVFIFYQILVLCAPKANHIRCTLPQVIIDGWVNLTKIYPQSPDNYRIEMIYRLSGFHHVGF